MVSLFLLQYKAVGVSYMLDKSRLSIRFLPPYSGEGRKKTANNAKQNGSTVTDSVRLIYKLLYDTLLHSYTNNN